MSLSGARIGRLSPIFPHGKAADGHCMWVCKCECGNEVVRQGNNLLSAAKAGHDSSCGCARPKPALKHGKHGSREYRSWLNMVRRCHSETDKDFRNYGARGIFVCPEWRISFATFYQDMGPAPARHSLDRIDVNGGYYKSNCRWADNITQARNKRNSHYVDWQGERLHINDVAVLLGISSGAAIMRLKRGKLYASA